jgi:hypothetical protein
VGIVTVKAIAVMVFKEKRGNASHGYHKKYKRNDKRSHSAVNSVPRTAEPLSKKKHKPAPTRMLSKPESIITPFHCQMMIVGHFLMDGAPMQSEWYYGDDGAISKTLTLVGLPRNQASQKLIARVFAEVEDCVGTNTDYAGITKQERQGHSHRPPVILLDDGPIVNMIADCIENGFGLQNTTRHMNLHLTELGRETITVNAVYGCI